MKSASKKQPFDILLNVAFMVLLAFAVNHKMKEIMEEHRNQPGLHAFVIR
jgi:hypothetical protein